MFKDEDEAREFTVRIARARARARTHTVLRSKVRNVK